MNEPTTIKECIEIFQEQQKGILTEFLNNSYEIMRDLVKLEINRKNET